jgi:hypothetical protein
MLIQQSYGLGAIAVLSFCDKQLLVVAIARGGDDSIRTRPLRRDQP